MSDQLPTQGRLQELVSGLSVERLQPYRLPRDISPDEGEYDWLLRYIWNIKLCESLYPGLQNLEVALRNAIHNTLSEAYETRFWFLKEGLLKVGEREQISRVERLLPPGKKKIAGKYIAELGFGFWISLFHKRYHDSLMPKIMKAAFPRKAHPLKRSQVVRELEAIRKLRNRVFHHEPIWNNPRLAVLHNHILQYVAWLNYELFIVTRGVDGFEAIHQSGTAPYKEIIAEIG
ncbi:Abi family protein [Pseudodesulfovibrio pelocollis]|uniref:Abi family protein n=1 Tax=Pseudodesulfovibrio pelocollis TaxID=3051432 RepID=UPI00255A9001|nr:Abi family protein [Pseudodesulfovibrio sp. SB368]